MLKIIKLIKISIFYLMRYHFCKMCFKEYIKTRQSSVKTFNGLKTLPISAW